MSWDLWFGIALQQHWPSLTAALCFVFHVIDFVWKPRLVCVVHIFISTFFTFHNQSLSFSKIHLTRMIDSVWGLSTKKQTLLHNQIVTWPIQCGDSLTFNGCFYVTYLCKAFPEWALSSWTTIWTYVYLSSYNQKPVIQTLTKHLKISKRKTRLLLINTFKQSLATKIFSLQPKFVAKVDINQKWGFWAKFWT